MFKSDGKRIVVNAFGQSYDAEVAVMQYQPNGNTAVQLIVEEDDYAEPLCMLSVNTENQLPSGHFYLKEWSENAEIANDPNLWTILSECDEHEPYASGYVTARCVVIS